MDILIIKWRGEDKMKWRGKEMKGEKLMTLSNHRNTHQKNEVRFDVCVCVCVGEFETHP